jgi:hypothetical protein
LETRKRLLVAVPSGVVRVIGPLDAPAGTVVVMRVSLTTVKAAATPPANVTDVAPRRPVPVITTAVPTGPDVGEIDVIVGPGATVVTVKLPELVPVPAEVVTAIGPEVAPDGTVAVSCVAELTANDVAAVPLNVTDVVPVKPVPVTVTDVPTGPELGANPVTVGADAGVTEKLPELVPVPADVVTEIGPDVAPDGTVAVSCESVPAVNDAVVPLNFTAVAPVKPEPLTVTDVPGEPDVGANPLTVGAAGTVPEQPGSWNDPIRVCQLSWLSVVGLAS